MRRALGSGRIGDEKESGLVTIDLILLCEIPIYPNKSLSMFFEQETNTILAKYEVNIYIYIYIYIRKISDWCQNQVVRKCGLRGKGHE